MIPENEAGVIIEFASICRSMGWEIIHAQAGFPDLVVRHIGNGQEYRAEVEYKSSNFKAHKHNPFGCDLVIAWVHDWQDCLMPMWIVPEWRGEMPGTMTNEQREIVRLRIENESLQAQIVELRNNSQPEISNLTKSCPCPLCGKVCKNDHAKAAHMRWQHGQNGKKIQGG